MIRTIATGLILLSLTPTITTAAPVDRETRPALNTLQTGWETLVIPTNEWINVFCAEPTLDGQPLLPGDTIFVYDPDGILCGIDTLRQDSSYGFAPVYRDDIYSDEDEGAEPGDTLSFAVNGLAVETAEPIIWTANGDKHGVCRFLATTEHLTVFIDIKPGSCPNPLNLTGNLESGKAMLPVAVLGTEDFDVRDIDPSTITLAEVPVVRWSYEDVSRPKEDPEDTCTCHSERGDGYGDLTLKFDRADVADVLADAADWTYVPLVLTGELTDGTVIRGADCVRVQFNEKDRGNWAGKVSSPQDLALGNHPNPFNPSTTISFALPEAEVVTLRVYDVRGRLVRTLADGSFEAGAHSVEWNGTDGGNSPVASGVYFYRLTAGGVDQTRKMLLMK